MVQSVLFVCMGNICRSPTAKGFFDLHCKKRGLEAFYSCESAGTHGWHRGQPPDSRSISAAAAWGVDISSDLSRQVDREDYSKFDYILAMDRANLMKLSTQFHDTGRAELGLLLSFSGHISIADVPDPYFGGGSGFDEVCSLLNQASSDFLDHLESIRSNTTPP